MNNKVQSHLDTVCYQRIQSPTLIQKIIKTIKGRSI